MGSIDASRAGSSNIKSSSPLTGGKRLRELLKDPSNVVVCPGVFDGLSARLAVAAGFDALYMVKNVVFARLDFFADCRFRQVLGRRCLGWAGLTWEWQL
jgi:hypothetical protein